MACEECERRRRELALALEASKLWVANPLGPTIHEIYLRLRADKGDTDAQPIRPNT